jgi:hypothetical protein
MANLPLRRVCSGPALAAISLLLFGATALAGWEKPADPQTRAEIVYTDSGKWVLDLACSKNVVLFLKYPGKAQSGTATIVIGNGKKKVSVRGEFDTTHDIDPRDPPFSAAWIGKGRDPANLDTVMSILFSGQPLTFEAEGARYVLPGIDANVAARYKSDC